MGKILTQGPKLQQFSLFHPLTAALALAAPLCLSAAPASAEQAPEPPSLPGGDVEEPPPPPEDPVQAQLQELTDRLREMQEQQAKKAASPLTINGYVDFGGFIPFGNHGQGYVEDLGQTQFPQYRGMYGWTFLGDILSTAVNSRGEVADLGQAAGLIRPRFDSIHSNGAAGFILNEFNLRLGYSLTDRAILRTSVNFVPRSGTDFALGDFVDVDIAEMEYVVTDDGNTSVWAGKILPVFGIEYKERKSDQRFGITPSLIQRYTSGPQLGVKVRSKLLQDWIIVAASVTNNTSGTEQFHFQSEIDKNNGKTLNGRLALNIPIGDFVGPLSGHHLELGASGEYGPQDWATDTSGNTWFAGLDLQYLSANFMVKAQAIRGHAPGESDALCRADPTSCVWHLDLHTSGYVEIDAMVTGWLGLMVRGERRDAFVALGMNRLYLTKEERLTGAVRIVFSPHIVLKAEYLWNHEYGGIAQFENNVLTSSLVLAF